MAKFQIMLAKEWKDYEPEEDKCLKRAFMSGFANTRYKFRGATYEYNFEHNTQKNPDTGKTRQIRSPHGWTRPDKKEKFGADCDGAVCIVVKPGWPGTTVDVPIHGQNVKVNVPRSARPGQQMIVPLPAKGKGKGKGGGGHGGHGGHGGKGSDGGHGGKGSEPSAPPADGGEKKSGGWSTGAKVAAVGGGVAVGAAAVGGGLLAAHAAEHGIDATGDMLADGAADAGEAIADGAEVALDGIVEGAEVAGEWVEGAAEDVAEWTTEAGETIGDFVMDLF